MTAAVPIPDSYWLLDGWLLAGEYPGAYATPDAQARLKSFLAAGIRTFIDLTQEDEGIDPYEALLASVAADAGVDCRHMRLAIADLDIPSPAQMRAILYTIHAEVAASRPAYVHCFGGIGRTGTVAGCWLVEQGMPPDAALAEIARLRRGTPDAFRQSPETWEQIEFVRNWTHRQGWGN